MTSSTFSSMLFLLLLVFSLHMDEALGAQTEIRKLKEIIKMRRNLEGNEYRSSNMAVGRSVSNHCHSKTYNNIVTTNLPDDSSSPCIKCDINHTCYSCTKNRHCQSFNGSPLRCTVTEKCCLIIS